MSFYDPVRKTFKHRKMGQLRVISAGRELFFCIRDISRILGYGEQGKEIRKYAFHLREYSYGWRTLHFMNETDFRYMMLFEKSSRAEELQEWLRSEVVHDMHHDTYFCDDDIDDGNEEPYIIYRRDYDKLIYSFMTVCHHLTLLCDSVSASVPVERTFLDLYEVLNEAEKAYSDILEMYDISQSDMREELTDTTLGQFGKYAVPVEEKNFLLEYLLKNRFKHLEAEKADTDNICDLMNV